MIRTVCRGLVFSLALATALPAQKSSAPVADALRAVLQRAQRIVVAADEMPAEKYALKPMPERPSYGGLLTSVASGNDILCAAIAGTKASEQAETDARADIEATAGLKDVVVARLKESFDYCTKALGSLGDAKLGDNVPFPGGLQVTRARVILILAAQWEGVYELQAPYFSLNDLPFPKNLPP